MCDKMRTKCGTILAAVVCAAACSAGGVFLSPMRGGDVNYRPMRTFDDAVWVWTAEAGESRFFRLRCDFDSDGSPLVMHVSADERYVLLLDGNEISRGPARGMVSHWFCQKVEAKPLSGKHRIEAVVWTLGEDAPTAQLSNGGGFFLKAHGSHDAKLTTGKGMWRIAPLSGTATDGRTCKKSFGCGTQFKVVGCSVLDEEPPSSAWADVRHVSKPTASGVDSWGVVPSGWAVYESALPEMMMRPVKPGEIPKGKIEIPAGTSREWTFDLGNYYCAYPFMTVSGGKPDSMRIEALKAALAE